MAHVNGTLNLPRSQCLVKFQFSGHDCKSLGWQPQQGIHKGAGGAWNSGNGNQLCLALCIQALAAALETALLCSLSRHHGPNLQGRRLNHRQRACMKDCRMSCQALFTCCAFNRQFQEEPPSTTMSTLCVAAPDPPCTNQQMMPRTLHRSSFQPGQYQHPQCPAMNIFQYVQKPASTADWWQLSYTSYQFLYVPEVPCTHPHLKFLWDDFNFDT